MTDNVSKRVNETPKKKKGSIMNSMWDKDSKVHAREDQWLSRQERKGRK